MQAVRFHEHGDLDVLRLEDVAEPLAGAGEAVIRVRACGVNRLDLMARAGRTGARIPLPHISGSEVAGEVAAIGPGVTGVKPGDRVAVAPYLFCGTCEFCLRGEETRCLRSDILGLASQGGYAEYVRAPAANLIPIPAGLGFEQAAALALATLTAYHMLVSRARVQPGEDVLVLAAGSGVGSAAVQIAKLLGARVIATAGDAEKLARARQLGADFTIDHYQQDIVQEVKSITGKRGVDIAFEHVGTATWDKSVAALTRGGRLVTCGTLTGAEGKVNLWTLFAKEISLIGAYGGTRAELRTVLQLAAGGKLQAIIHRVFPLEAVAEAQAAMAASEQFGKLIIAP